MLTEEQKNKYLGSPYLCPYCGSDELSLGKVTAVLVEQYETFHVSNARKGGRISMR